MSLLACGQCVDRMISPFAPFLWYWLVLFAMWALIWGAVALVWSLAARDRVVLPPWPFAILTPPLFFLTGGSLLAPTVLAWAVWLACLFGVRNRRPEGQLQQVEARLLHIMVVSAIALVPVGFMRQLAQHLGWLNGSRLWQS